VIQLKWSWSGYNVVNKLIIVSAFLHILASTASAPTVIGHQYCRSVGTPNHR
jgi:hypothetical protein